MSIPICSQPTSMPPAGARAGHEAVTHLEIYRRVRAALAAAGATTDEAEEMSQVAVFECWVRHAAIRDPDMVVSYAVTIAMRALAAERRKCNRLSPLALFGVDLVDGSVNPALGMEGAELGALIIEALALLTERDRYLVLASHDGVTVDRMAAATGLKRASVAPSLHRAKLRLRAHLIDLDIGADGLAA